MQFSDFSVKPTQIEILNFLKNHNTYHSIYLELFRPHLERKGVHPRSEHSGRIIKSQLFSDAFFI